MSVVGVARWVLFCEGPTDQRTVHTLIDELLSLHCDWARDLLEIAPESVRNWVFDSVEKRPWFDLHKVNDLAETLKIRPHFGHFGSEPQQPDAVMFDSVFRIVDRWERSNRDKTEVITAVVIVRDMDNDRAGRSAGILQAIEHGFPLPKGVELVVGKANCNREAWVLAGFDPQSAEEREALIVLKQELGFAPNEKAHLLTAQKDSEKKNGKRVLRELGVDSERERECLRVQSMEQRGALIARGDESGLKDFVEEVEAKLVRELGGQVIGRNQNVT